MLTIGQRRQMLMFAGIIAGFLVSFLVLNMAGATADNTSSWASLGTMAVFVIVGIIAALIVEKATRASYQAAFVNGKDPIKDASAKLPRWYTDVRMSRGRYWLINLIVAILFFGGAFAAYLIVPSPLNNYVVVLLVVALFVTRLILVRFRLNDISPESQISLNKKGLFGLFSGWLIDFAPSHPGKESSFKEMQNFYLPDGTPNVKNFFLNLRSTFIYFGIAILLILLITLLR
jgi:hypothetical protein